ncbi:MAG TPA: RNA polymerase sigma-70 factor [Bacteroidales bacterium]|nr:RNA polymerase sigma-70 factor [Bacteroidales bacterium]
MTQIDADSKTIQELQKGSIVAFDELYKKYSSKIYAFAYKYLKSAEDAEELVQSVFLKVWENHNKLKKEASFKSFLFTITYNDLCKIFRKRSYSRKYYKEQLEKNSYVSSETSEKIDYNSTLERINTIIDKLPAKQKNIFIKSRIEGKATKDIAFEMGLSAGTIDNYISTSLKFIKKCLNEENLAAISLFICLFLQ